MVAHIALPIPDVTWRSLGLAQWQLPRLQEFQAFVDTLSRLWKGCGHFADFMRIEEDLDQLGVEIAQAYIREGQETLSSLLQGFWINGASFGTTSKSLMILNQSRSQYYLNALLCYLN